MKYATASFISLEEFVNIAVSVVAISLALTFNTAGGLSVKPPDFVFYMGVFTLTVGIGFVLHELAHKFTAMRYGAWAQFRAWPAGLLLMLGMALFLPIMFLAPGAVYIYSPYINKKQNGIISVAGPLTNLALVAVFGVIYAFSFGTVREIASLGASVNAFLAFFNMIPIFPLDGSKVLAWDWRVWLAVIAVAFLLSGGF
ncbi:hypothetical protein AUJ17_05285 [Candidatus Micrarchaeota archaeon CG1_02_47_40]|nr:MAG: hypothetical protein AUJ17_05285 [Candidatus Micrarchaeota archaeon CG1_02_47_40]